MSIEPVPLSVLSEEIGMARTHARRYILKNGFHFFRMRTHASGNQVVLALSQEDAEAVRTLRIKQGYHLSGQGGIVESNGQGWFYLVQPMPHILPTRIKLGFASDVAQRLDTYKTLCPESQVIKSYPCHVSWERAAFASITRIDCIAAGIEVVDCTDVDALISRADAFFSIMPTH